jgi:hypothetical protein
MTDTNLKMVVECEAFNLTLEPEKSTPPVGGGLETQETKKDTPCGARTHDHAVKSRALYLTELRELYTLLHVWRQ